MCMNTCPSPVIAAVIICHIDLFELASGPEKSTQTFLTSPWSFPSPTSFNCLHDLQNTGVCKRQKQTSTHLLHQTAHIKTPPCTTLSSNHGLSQHAHHKTLDISINFDFLVPLVDPCFEDSVVQAGVWYVPSVALVVLALLRNIHISLFGLSSAVGTQYYVALDLYAFELQSETNIVKMIPANCN